MEEGAISRGVEIQEAADDRAGVEELRPSSVV